MSIDSSSICLRLKCLVQCLTLCVPVNSYWVPICIILGLVFGAILAFLIPAIYRRIKYPNYSQLRDLSAPVVT